MGTSLQERGLPSGTLPEEWLLARPAEISAVHAAHARAGARILLSCTFNLASPRLAAAGADVADLAERAIAAARAAGAPRIAGAVGPGGTYDRSFEALAAAGADLLWAETQLDLAEATAALASGRRVGLPTVVTLAFAEGAPFRLRDGALVEEALLALAGEGAAAVGVNCVEASAALERLVAAVAPRAGVPLVVKPSPGLPGAVRAPGAFAARVLRLVRAGAGWAGGCCGATEAHVRAIAEALGQELRG